MVNDLTRDKTKYQQEKLTSIRLKPANSPLIFIDLITKANSVNDGKFEVNATFLQIVRSWPQIDAVLVVARLFVFKHGVKKSVH